MINALLLVPEITKGMKSIGSKSLLKIKQNKYIIEYQIEQLLTIHPNIDITVAIGFDADKIKKILNKYNNIKYIYNPRFDITNLGKCIELYLEEKHEINNLFLINSGILFKKGTFHKNQLNKTSKLFFLDKPKNNFDIGCGSTDNIEYLFYDLPKVWSECVFLDSFALDKLKILSINQNISHMYTFEIINELLAMNTKFESEEFPKSHFLKITSIKDLDKAKVFV
jgi:hypothetical protein